ncbi:hypothetical protein [Ruminococcus sp.]|uniref:hypothetical protein n=1 Tax=Ruminococcus sp. TaxID=41978 RepID=UPI003AB4F7CF
MSKTRIRAVWGTAQSEYIKWICSSRMLIFLCALIFIDQFAVKPLVEISKQTGVKLGLFEPFIAITNSDVLLMIMSIVFITLIGDFPKNDGNMLFCVQRTWRVNWLLGQMLFLVMSSLTFMLGVILSTFLAAAGYLQWSEQWSATVTDYSRLFPENADSVAANLIPENLYYQYVPLRSAGNSAVLIFLLLLVCGLIMLVFAELRQKLLGVGINVFLLLAGGAAIYLETPIRWAFPCCNAIVKTHFTKFFRQQIYEISYSYIYFFSIIVSLILLSLVLLRKTNFLTAGEE